MNTAIAIVACIGSSMSVWLELSTSMHSESNGRHGTAAALFLAVAAYCVR